MNKTLKLNANKSFIYDIIVAFIFLSYFCKDILISFFARVFNRSDIFYWGYTAVFFFCVVLLAIARDRKKLAAPLVCYIIIALLFLVTLYFHPEYEAWYFERTYGIHIQFFRATGGIWAFLVICLVSEKETMLRYLRLAMWLMFIFLGLRFMSAQIRGYWIGYGADYSRYEGQYNLGFGYSVLVTVLYFAAEAFLNQKKLYYIPFAVGSVFILLGGSRGAIIWVLAVFVLMLPYRWHTMKTREKTIFLLLLIVFTPIVILLYLNYTQVVQWIIAFMSRHGISSRTITTLLNGEFADMNGRDEIYQITIARIKEGGLWGNGVFGERVVVGQKFRWGYAHNFFLELYAAFGYVGGTLLSVLLIYRIIRTAIYCRSTAEQIIFITFFVSSLKLLLSDSFWFNSSFWALLALLWLWRKPAAASTEHRRVRLKRG